MSATKKRKFLNPKKKGNGKNKELFAETHAVAPAPSRDYYALQLFQKKFIWTRWKISHGPYAAPLQRVVSLEEFSKDMTMQHELAYIFGDDITNLMNDLAYKKWSLTSMPSSILQKIFTYLSVPDILRLSQTCKRLSKECSKNELWQGICKNQWKILIHNDIEKAGLIGWKRVYLEKMRPKRYKASTTTHVKNKLLQWHRVGSVSTLNTPDSRKSTKSNFTTHNPIPIEIKNSEASRSTSEIFGKSFSRNSDSRPTSTAKFNFTPRSNADRKHLYQSSHSVINLMPLVENPRENEHVRKNKSPRNKCKVTSIRTRSVTPQTVQSTEVRNKSLQSKLTRPNTGKISTLKR